MRLGLPGRCRFSPRALREEAPDLDAATDLDTVRRRFLHAMLRESRSTGAVVHGGLMGLEYDISACRIRSVAEA